MPYLGNSPALATGSVEYQDLTGVTGSPAKRGFTLEHAVGSAQDIEVFVNNVRQEPGVAYNVGNGTTLTMTGDVETTDDFYVVFQGKAIGTTSGSTGGGGTYKGDNGTVNAGNQGDIFRVHQQQLDTNTTINSDENALAAGPLTIASGVTLTVNGNLTVV